MRTSFHIVLLAGFLNGASAWADREILICVAASAPSEIRALADGLAAAPDRVPLLAALRATQGAGAARVVASESLLDRKQSHTAAFNHLVVVGIPDQDSLLRKVWGHQERLESASRSVYRLGYGTLTGSVGVVGSDWNPFLYSQAVTNNGYTTCLVRLGGVDSKAVGAAVKAFQCGLLNGIVSEGVVQRPETSLLDLDPSLEPPPQLSKTLPLADGRTALYAGWTQPSSEEYRAYIDAGGAEPSRVWRVKYFEPGALEDVSARAWVMGPHRMAYGNAITIARFGSAATAQRVAEQIGKSKGFADAKIGTRTVRAVDQPTDEALPNVYGRVCVFEHGCQVILMSLPPSAEEAALQSLSPDLLPNSQ